MPGQPKNFSDFQKKFPKSLQITNIESDDNERKKFLLFNDYVGTSKKEGYAVTFASDAGLEGLIRFPIWVIDGTFETAPKHPRFKQILVIVGVDAEQRSFPLVWSFLSHKTLRCYLEGVLLPLRKALFEFIAQCDSDLGLNKMKAKVCVSDFTMGISHAINQVFPNFSVHGCVFEWKQLIELKVDKIGLAKIYESNSPSGNIFRHFVGMVKALIYVHPACVPHFYNALAMYMWQKIANTTSIWYQHKAQVGLFFGQNVLLSNETCFRSRNSSPTSSTPGSATTSSSRGTPSPSGPGTGASST